MKIRQILKDSINIFRSKPLALIGEFILAILIYIAAVLATYGIIFLLVDKSLDFAFLGIILLCFVANAFLGMILNTSLQSVRGNISIKNLKVPFSFVWKGVVITILVTLAITPIYLIAIIILTALVLIGSVTKITIIGCIFLGLLILLLWIGIKVSFTQWIIIDTPKINLFKAIGESWSLTNKNMWNIIKLTLVMFLMEVVIFVIPILSIKFIENLDIAVIVLVIILFLLIIIFVEPFKFIIVAKFYDEMVIRKGNSSSDNISGVKSIESQDIEKITIINEVKKEQLKENNDLEIKEDLKEDKINLTKEDNLVNENTQDIINENIQKSIENKSEKNEEE